MKPVSERQVERFRRRLSRGELKDSLYRRRFVVPNAVTLASMFCGFLTIIYASSGRFEKAVISIGFSILLDGLDGRVARKLNATSKFGGEFDSFADFVSFGIAPAILIYHWAFVKVADEIGVAIAFIFALCSSSRLARFNITESNLKGFQGLPTPGAAAPLAAMVNYLPRVEQTTSLAVFSGMFLLMISYLMVSNVEYLSIKQLKFSRVPPYGRILLGGIIALFWYDPQRSFFISASVYALSGPVVGLWRILNHKPPVQTPSVAVQIE